MTESNPILDVPPPPEHQAKYEVRFDWGIDGAEAVAPGAGLVVVVDALDAPGSGRDLTVLEANLVARGVPVLRAGLRNRSAVARWALDYQKRLGSRAIVAVIASGESRASGETRFAVEDLLAAGALIDALAEVGIDFCSPEAAAAAAAFGGLRRATSHLLTASVTGQALIAAGRRDAVVEGAKVDASEEIEVLRA